MNMRTSFLLSTLALSACTAPYDPTVPTAVDRSNQLNIQANKVSSVTEAATITFAHKSVELDVRKSPSLDFLNTQSVQKVLLYTPASDALAEPRELAITRMIRAAGIPITRIAKEVMANLPADTYRVEAEKLQVTGPSCPNWSQNSTLNFYNKPFSQMGCAIVTNVGAMVSDPQDLVRGSGNVQPDSTRNAAIIGAYKSGGAAAAAASTSADSGASEASSASGATSASE